MSLLRLQQPRARRGDRRSALSRGVQGRNRPSRGARAAAATFARCSSAAARPRSCAPRRCRASSTPSAPPGGSIPTPRSRSKPIRPASKRGGFAAIASAGVNRLSIGVQALNDADLKALGRKHTAAEALAAVEARGVALSALQLRPHLRPAGAGRAGMAPRARRSARPRRRPCLALSTDHRARHHLRAPARRRQTRASGRGFEPRPVRDDAGSDRSARAAGLRGLEPRPPRRREPPQPHLLALRRICRRRPRRARAFGHARKGGSRKRPSATRKCG